MRPHLHLRSACPLARIRLPESAENRDALRRLSARVGFGVPRVGNGVGGRAFPL